MHVTTVFVDTVVVDTVVVDTVVIVTIVVDSAVVDTVFVDKVVVDTVVLLMLLVKGIFESKRKDGSSVKYGIFIPIQNQGNSEKIYELPCFICFNLLCLVTICFIKLMKFIPHKNIQNH